jgi:hypothetical protein
MCVYFGVSMRQMFYVEVEKWGYIKGIMQ